MGVIKPLDLGMHRRTAFIAYWGLANGPLAFAAVLLKNSLIFHDILNLASCFIHLTPCSTTWTMRWNYDRYEETFPGIFDIPDYNKNEEGFFEVIGPAMMFYFVWWVLYFIYMSAYGRFLGKHVN